MPAPRDVQTQLPSYYLSAATVAEIKRQTAALAEALQVVGLMNVQFAIQEVVRQVWRQPGDRAGRGAVAG